LHFVVFGLEIIAWSVTHVRQLLLEGNRARYVLGCKLRLHLQLEESIGNLQHEDMWMIMLMADEDTLTRSPHPILLVVLFEPLQPRKYRRIFLRLIFFGAKCVIAEREQANSLWLIR